LYCFKAVRNITWSVENLRNFVDKNHGKEFDGEQCTIIYWGGEQRGHFDPLENGFAPLS